MFFCVMFYLKKTTTPITAKHFWRSGAHYYVYLCHQLVKKNLTRGSQTISKIDKTATRGCMQSDFYGKLALSRPSLFGSMRSLSRASFGACSQASKIDVSLFVIFNFFQVEGLNETRDTIYNFIWINDGSTDRWLKTSILYSIWLPRLHVTS